MTSTVGMDTLAPGRRAAIQALETRGGMRRRLLDLGFAPGSTVMALLAGAGITAYLIRGAVIALRREDAHGVRVLPGEVSEEWRGN